MAKKRAWSRLDSLAAAAFLALAPSAAADRPEVTIGIVDTFSPDFYIDTYSATLDHIEKSLPQYRFRYVEIDYRKTEKDIGRTKPAFLVTSASTFVSLIEGVGAHQVATKKPKMSEDVARTVGSVFVVKAESPIRTLADARGKRAAASSRESFDGWIIAAGEIARQFGEGSVQDFFSSVAVTGYTIPDVSLLVSMGSADIGILGNCEYEMLLRTGQVRKEQLRVINEKPRGRGCVRSTDLYPDVVFSSLPNVGADVTRDVTVALLTMPDAGLDYTWTIANDFVPTYELLSLLRIGPYAPRPWTAARVWRNYRTEILLLLALVLAVGFHIVSINILVQKRTRQLADLLTETRAYYRDAQATREKLLRLERTNVVSQLSSMFAHEIKQPIMNISLYAGALRMLLSREGTLGEKEKGLIGRIDAEVERSSDIVEHVRGYAKKAPSKRVVCSLEETARSNPEVKRRGVEVRVGPGLESSVLADPFELHFIIDNFVRNAFSAAEASGTPSVSLSIVPEGRKLRLTVSDNGPEISDKVFSRLGKAGRSGKEDGLGFGLSIASTLAESMGGHVEFARRPEGGLDASLVLTRADSEEKGK